MAKKKVRSQASGGGKKGKKQAKKKQAKKTAKRAAPRRAIKKKSAKKGMKRPVKKKVAKKGAASSRRTAKKKKTVRRSSAKRTSRVAVKKTPTKKKPAQRSSPTRLPPPQTDTMAASQAAPAVAEPQSSAPQSSGQGEIVVRLPDVPRASEIVAYIAQCAKLASLGRDYLDTKPHVEDVARMVEAPMQELAPALLRLEEAGLIRLSEPLAEGATVPTHLVIYPTIDGLAADKIFAETEHEFLRRLVERVRQDQAPR